MFDRIGFLTGEAATAMRRNYSMTFAAIITAAVALFLCGGLSYTYWRASQYASGLTSRFEMRVVLRDNTTYTQITDTAGQIRAIPGVREVSWIPKEKAWERDRQRYPADMTEGVQNPYPDEFKVTIWDLHKGDTIASQIRNLATVAPQSGVLYEQQAQHFVDVALEIMRLVGGVAGGLLFAAAGLLIYNAIRLTVLARKVEIRVMELVGASRFTIRVPFLIEGVVQGALGGFIAGLLLLIGNEALRSFLATVDLAAAWPPYPFWCVTGVLCAAGAVYGLICSNIAVHIPLSIR